MTFRFPSPATGLKGVFAVMALAGLFGAGAASANPNLVLNGGFESQTLNGAASTTSYQINNDSTTSYTGAKLANWGNTGYGFVFTPGTADTSGAYSTQYSNTLTLWGPGGGTGAANYSNNGLTATSPAGGNFVAFDGDAGRGPLTQTVGGLVVGRTYNLSFYWAAAQQSGYSGISQQAWSVSWGDTAANTVTANTQTVTLASHGFSGWMLSNINFVATATSDVLSFMATGTPSGTPPFALLDGIVLVDAPEPASWAVLGIGVLVLAGLTRSRRRTIYA